MAGKLLGIGLLSAGCMAAAAGGAYLALRPAVVTATPEPTRSVPVTAEPVGLLGSAQVAFEPALEAAQAPSTVAERPIAPPARATLPPTESKTSATPALAPPPPLPVDVTAEPPLAAPPAVAVTSIPPAMPTAIEPPRYVPDAPLPMAVPPVAVQEASKRDADVEELTVEKHSVIGIRLDESISTHTARVEDRVTATVSRDVTVNGRTAIPADVRLEGTVTLVEHGGKFRNRPRLGLRFDRMILADGTRVPISTDTIYRVGDSPTANSTTKVGAGAVAGAVLGAVLGGKKGAVIGGAAGAVGGAAVAMKEDAGETSFPAGAPLTVRLTEDVVMTINR